MKFCWISAISSGRLELKPAATEDRPTVTLSRPIQIDAQLVCHLVFRVAERTVPNNTNVKYLICRNWHNLLFWTYFKLYRILQRTIGYLIHWQCYHPYLKFCYILPYMQKLSSLPQIGKCWITAHSHLFQCIWHLCYSVSGIL